MTAARIAFDIGGTFTDLILDDGARLHRSKVLTTPSAPADAALAGLDDLLGGTGLSWADVTEVVHGTTLVTNALLERRFATTGMLTTRGFRDVLAMGRQQRYDAYDLRIEFPVPLVPRPLRVEIDERTLASGRVLRPVDVAEVTRAAETLVAAGVRSIAICFLHAYREPANERLTKQTVLDAYPDLTVVTSSAAAPEIREYERSATAAATAAVAPLVDTYLDALATGLASRGCGGPLHLMQSSAHTAPDSAVRTAPITLLESGPAGGARAAAGVDTGAVLGFDMGGTTAKACLTEGDGALPVVGELEVARTHRFKAGSGMPVRVPSIDLVEIGAGGGSIAAADRLGLLRVGPESAGADPGPACYGFGGTQPTVTDANLYLGFLGADARLAGRMALDRDAAEKALGRLAEQLGLGVHALALGVHRLVNEQMAAAARVHVIDRGGDPRRVSLVVTGGAGPTHAAEVARLLGCPEAVVPVGAGTASAVGFLGTPAGVERSRSLPRRLADIDWSAVGRIYEQLEHEVAQTLGTGRDDPALAFEHRADARLVGQVHALTVPLRRLDDAVASDIRAAYQRRFRVDPGDLPIEILTWRCQGVLATPRVSAPEHTAAEHAAAEPASAGSTLYRVWAREQLTAGTVADGPLLVTEAETTTVVPAGDQLQVGERGELRIRLGKAAQ